VGLGGRPRAGELYMCRTGRDLVYISIACPLRYSAGVEMNFTLGRVQ
jgi:hypothetical protein